MAYSAGTAFLQIVPSFRGFTNAVRAEASKAGAESGNAFSSEFQKAVNGAGKNTTVGPDKAKVAKDGADAGGSFADAFRRRLEAAQRSFPTLNVGVATSEAEQKLKDLQAEMIALRDARVGVDINETAAIAKLEDLQRRLARLSTESPSIQVRVDAGRAALELAALQRQVGLLDHETPTITPKVDTKFAVPQVRTLYLALAGLAPALIPLGAAAIPAFAALTSGAGAAALGIGTVVVALKPTIEAIKLAGKAAGGSAADIQKYQEALAGLTPAGRDFVKFVTGELMPIFKGISNELQSAFLPGLTAGFRAALPSVQIFRGALVQAALGMSDLAQKTGEALGSPFFQGFFRFIEGTARQDLNLLGQILGNLVKGFLGLVQAFDPLTQSLARGLADLTARFAAFGASAAAGTNATFNRFLQYLHDALPAVRDFIAALAKASGNLIVAFAPLGTSLLPLLTDLLNVIAKMPPALIQAMAIAFYSLALSLKAVNVALLVLAADPVVLAAAGLVALGLAAVVCYQRFQTFRDVVNGVAAFIRDNLTVIMYGLGGAFAGTAVLIAKNWDVISGAALTAWGVIRPVLLAMGQFLNTFVVPAFHGLGVAAVASWQSIEVAVTGAWAVIRGVFTGIGDVLNATAVPAFRLFAAVVAPIWTELAGDVREWGSALRLVFGAVAVLIAGIIPTFRLFADAAQAAFGAVTRAGQAFGVAVAQVVLPPLRLLGEAAAAGFGALKLAGQAAWDILRPILTLLGSALAVTVVPVLRLFGQVAQAAFGAAGVAVGAFWSLVHPILTGIGTVLQNNVFPVVRAFATVVVGPTFQDAGRFISSFWNNIAHPALSAFTDFLSGPVGVAVHAAGAVISTVFAGAARAIAAFWDTARVVLDTLRTYILGPLSAAWTTVGNHISTVLNAIKIALEVWQSATLVVLGAVVAFLGGPAARAWGAFRDMIDAALRAAASFAQRFAGDVQRIFGSIAAYLAGPVTAAWGAFRTMIDTTFRLTQSFAQRFWDALRVIFGAVHAFLAGAVTVAWNGFRALVEGVFRALTTAANAWWGGLQRVFNLVAAYLAGPLAFAWSTFRGLVDAVFKAIVSAANVWWSGLSRVFTLVRDFLAGALSQAFTTFRDVAGRAFSAVSSAVSQAGGAIVTVMGGIRSAIAGTVDFIDKTWSRLAGIFKSPVSVLIHDVYGGIRSVWNATASHLPGIDKLPGLGSIPGFARGGYIPGYSPGRDTQLAWVSPGEGVLVPEAVRGIANTMGTSPRQAIQSINSTYSARVPGQALKGDRLAFVAGGLVPGPLKKLGSGVANKAGSIAGKFKDEIGNAIGGVKNWVQGRIADSLNILLKPVRSLISHAIPGSDDWNKMVRAVPNTLLDGLLNVVKNKDAEFNAAAAVGDYGTAEQQKNASIIIGVGKRLGASHRDLLISLMTALQESGLRNIAYGDRDSLGLFQQRAAWGTREQRLDPAEAARMFFQGGHGGQRGLFSFKDRDQMSLTAAAQAVQVSAFPNAYAKWEDEARQLLDGPGPLPVSGAGGILNGLRFARSQAGKPYVWGASGPNSYDCSGFMSAIANVVQGRYPYSRRFATPEMAGYPSQVGPFVRGANGAFSIGVKVGNPGHTAGTINGVNVESRGGQGVLIGPAARGTYNSYFDKYYHLAGYARGGLVRDLMRKLPGDPPFDILSPRGRAYDPAALQALELADTLKYDSGGYLPPGVSIAVNKTNKPEPILTSGQWSDLTAAVNRPVAAQVAAPMVAIEHQYVTPDRSNRDLAEELYWVSKGRG